jgi:lipoprotein NlpD
MLVKEGDQVEVGQTIAELGSSSENRPVLHFEIRRDGKPVNPRRYLPS